MGESSGKWQVLGFWWRARELGHAAHGVGRLVRVDVAVGELHVAVVDAEAADLPEVRNDARIRKVRGKCFHRRNGSNFQEMSGARV